MDLLIDIKKGSISISLKEGTKTVDEVSFPDMRNLTKKLLSEIDRLLKRNKLDICDVIEARVDSDQSDSFTSTRIARVVANVMVKMKAVK
jgi:hypothetical protein